MTRILAKTNNISKLKKIESLKMDEEIENLT